MNFLEISRYFQSKTIKVLAFNGFSCLKVIKLLKGPNNVEVRKLENELH